MYTIQHKRRLAFTLIELLIVMAILVLLAAVTLPSVKEILKDQKISQGARVVQGFAESCKARAVATGRPVAMILDRNFLDGSGPGVSANDTVTRLTVGEVFPPYQGDWAGAVATISSPGAVLGQQVAAIPLAQAASLWDSSSNGPSGMVEADDVIQFGDSPRTYRIPSVVYLTGGTVLNIPFENPPIDQLYSNATGSPAYTVPTQEATIFPAAPIKFRIFRKPTKSLAGSVTLPRGICVDLSVSGMGQSGRQFGAESISGFSIPTPAGYYGPVSIVFSPSGSIQDVYYSNTINGSHTSAVRHPAGDMIHLMIGHTDQVYSNPAGNLGNSMPGYLNQATIPSPAESSRDSIKYNVLDSANYWLTFNPFSGAIYTSQVQELTNVPAGAGALADVRTAQARSLALYGVQRTDP